MPEYLNSIESEPALKTFTETQKKALEGRGFLIFRLAGSTIASLRAEEVHFSSTWHRNDIFEKIKSRFSEVAIDPSNLYLKHSVSRDICGQTSLIEEFSKQIFSEIPGVKAVIASAPELVDVADQYKKLTHRSIFRFGLNNIYAVTTNVFDRHQIFVGEFYNGGAVVSYRFGEKYSDYKVLPFVIPG